MLGRLVWYTLPLVAPLGALAFVIAANRYVVPRVDSDRLVRLVRGVAIVVGFLVTTVLFVVIVGRLTLAG